MKKLVLLSAIFILAGCANTPPKNYIISEEKITLEPAKQEVHLIFQRDYNDDKDVGEKFRVIKPSHTAKVTGIKILQGVSSVFTGGSITGFSKFDLLGDVISTENIPQNYTLAKVREGIKKYVKLHNETKIHILNMYPTEWKLVYDELVGNDNYTLYYNFKLSYRYDDNNNNNKGNGQSTMGEKVLDCKEQIGGKTFVEWEKDNYLAVISATKQMADKCLAELPEYFSLFK